MHMDGAAPDAQRRAQKKRKHKKLAAKGIGDQVTPPAVTKKQKRARAEVAGTDAPAVRAAVSKPKAAVDRPQLAASPPDEQAAALLASYVSECGSASYLEQEAFRPECFLTLAQPASLEQQLKAAVPEWRGTLARAAPDVPPGSPVVLIIAGAALVRSTRVFWWCILCVQDTDQSLTQPRISRLPARH